MRKAIFALCVCMILAFLCGCQAPLDNNSNTYKLGKEVMDTADQYLNSQIAGDDACSKLQEAIDQYSPMLTRDTVKNSRELGISNAVVSHAMEMQDAIKTNNTETVIFLRNQIAMLIDDKSRYGGGK